MSGVTYDILYDILIKQNGDIHSDWDGTMLDVDAMSTSCSSPMTSSGWPGLPENHMIVSGGLVPPLFFKGALL